MPNISLPTLTVPWRQPIYNKKGEMHPLWQRFFQNVVDALALATLVIGSVAYVDEAASIAQTAIPSNALVASPYRVGYYIRVTRAGTISSSLIVTLRWTEGGVARSHVGSTLNGNTTQVYESYSAQIAADVGTDVTYEVTYASAGATAMQYALDVELEQVPETAS